MLLLVIFFVEKMKWVNNKIVLKSGLGNYELCKFLGVNFMIIINFLLFEF